MKLALIFPLCLAFVNQTLGQNFQNGDLDGIINGYSSLPNNWQRVPYNDPNCLALQVGNATPDLTSLYLPDSSIGANGNPFHGSTFVSGAFAGNSLTFSQEGIMQVIFGFAIGKKYLINLRQSVVKTLFYQDKSGSWAVYIDTVLAGITSPTHSNEPFKSTNLPWEARSIFFTAKDTVHLIKFLPMDDDTNYSISTTDTTGALYMGIDSIGLDIVTSLPEPLLGGAFKVFPNPSNGSFVITSAGNLNKQTTLSIADVCGKQIDIIPIVNSTTSYENTSLTNGLYFYTIRSKDEELQRGKFLVVK
jgi:hypothetical protein